MGFIIHQDDLESLPFPNDETEFNLPDDIFESSSKPHSSASESSAAADEGMNHQGLNKCHPVVP